MGTKTHHRQSKFWLKYGGIKESSDVFGNHECTLEWCIEHITAVVSFLDILS
jgi:hypothetical protein